MSQESHAGRRKGLKLAKTRAIICLLERDFTPTYRGRAQPEVSYLLILKYTTKPIGQRHHQGTSIKAANRIS